ncbi:MAG: TetR family transcriptional regulator [Pseudomonadota bacterium]
MSITDKRHSDPERALSRRKQVLDAAAVCFSRSGFHGASMAEISKAAGMSAGHIYNYFDGKDAIIAAFVEQNVERISALMRNLEQHADPLQAMLDEVPNNVRENLNPATWALQLEICAEAARNPKIAALLHDADLRSRSQFRVLMRRAREQHQLAADDATLDGRMAALIAMYQGLHIRALHNPGQDEAEVVAAVRISVKALLFS